MARGESVGRKGMRSRGRRIERAILSWWRKVAKRRGNNTVDPKEILAPTYIYARTVRRASCSTKDPLNTRTSFLRFCTCSFFFFFFTRPTLPVSASAEEWKLRAASNECSMSNIHCGSWMDMANRKVEGSGSPYACCSNFYASFFSF